MFNSTLIDDYGSALINPIWERQKEIFEFPYDSWMDSEANGEDVSDCYVACFFPPGFIERDKERAKRVIKEIYDNVQSPVIRHDVDAIHFYVMYYATEAWFDNEYTQAQDLVPEDVKSFLSKFEEENRDDSEFDAELTDAERIRSWFIDKDFCLGDFEDAYDPDFMDVTVAEAVAVLYLSERGIPDFVGADIRDLVDLLPNELYYKVKEKLEKEEIQRQREASQYVDKIWPQLETYFNVLSHADSLPISSHQGAYDTLWIFKDWVENNGGWKIIQTVNSSIKEIAIHMLIFLGAKKYLESQNLDMNCENNIGVGQEDFKISRGNDKTVIEVKLSNNPKCVHGFEKQLPRYAEAEHTGNMIYCLIDVGNEKVVNEIKELQEIRRQEGKPSPELYVIDAKPQKSASVR